MNVEKIREAFPLTKEYIYFNNAATGACSTHVATALKEYADSRLALSPEASRWNERIVESRRLFAQLIGAREGEIAFVPNTTAGLNTISDMVCTRKGNVVTTDIGFPSNVLVWLKHAHVETRFAKNRENKIPLEEISRHVDGNTIAVAVDQVGWFNGFKHDLRAVAEEAHEKGAYFVVDAIQSAGSMKIDVRRDEIDFLSAGSYKWLLGPPGAGFLYVREDLIDKFTPPFPGINSMDEEQLDRNIYDAFDLYQLKFSGKVQRYELGTVSDASCAGTWASMKMILKLGIDQIEKRLRKLDGYLVDRLEELHMPLQSPRGERSRHGIVNFKAKDNRELEKRLRTRKMVVTARVGGIRVSPGFFNTEDEIDRFVEAVRELTR